MVNEIRPGTYIYNDMSTVSSATSRWTIAPRA
jgi:hypothetical protein